MQKAALTNGSIDGARLYENFYRALRTLESSLVETASNIDIAFHSVTVFLYMRCSIYRKSLYLYP